MFLKTIPTTQVAVERRQHNQCELPWVVVFLFPLVDNCFHLIIVNRYNHPLTQHFVEQGLMHRFKCVNIFAVLNHQIYKFRRQDHYAITADIIKDALFLLTEQIIIAAEFIFHCVVSFIFVIK